jgi:hypothetical protein
MQRVLGPVQCVRAVLWCRTLCKLGTVVQRPVEVDASAQTVIRDQMLRKPAGTAGNHPLPQGNEPKLCWGLGVCSARLEHADRHFVVP